MSAMDWLWEEEVTCYKNSIAGPVRKKRRLAIGMVGIYHDHTKDSRMGKLLASVRKEELTSVGVYPTL